MRELRRLQVQRQRGALPVPPEALNQTLVLHLHVLPRGPQQQLQGAGRIKQTLVVLGLVRYRPFIDSNHIILLEQSTSNP